MKRSDGPAIRDTLIWIAAFIVTGGLAYQPGTFGRAGLAAPGGGLARSVFGLAMEGRSAGAAAQGRDDLETGRGAALVGWGITPAPWKRTAAPPPAAPP